MSKKTTAEKMAVMAAYEAGNGIVCKFEDGSVISYKKCDSNDEPTWIWGTCDYYTVVEQWTPPAGEWNINIDRSCYVGKCQLFELATKTEFKTRQEAERAAKDFKFYHWMWHLANELNDGWVPDWNDEKQLKYRIYIVEGVIKKEPRWAANDLSPVFKSEETAITAIEIMKQWTWYWGEK